MQKRFIELVSQLIAQAELDCSFSPDDYAVRIPLSQISFNIGYFENQNTIIFQSAVGVLPEKNREPLLIELLNMNSKLGEFGGAGFGVDDDTVTLQSIIGIEDLSEEAFNNHALAFIEALSAAVVGFEEIMVRAANQTIGMPEFHAITI